MSKRDQIDCPNCDSQYIIEYDPEQHPEGPEVCPFCDYTILDDEYFDNRFNER